MLSYASNFEDVLLYRCFRNVQSGFYIDIGAHHPTFASVTRWFYDQGWSGINVEPGAEIDNLRAQRARDVNLALAVADFEGEAVFYEHSGCTATSSLMEATSPRVIEGAGRIVEKAIRVTTLRSLIDRYASDRHIHFLKIDAEGSEDAIVRGADWRRHRPEVLVIESTEPFTNIRRNAAWQTELQKNDYAFAYFDGVNDFWVRKESGHLLDCFKIPVNVLDGFRLYDPELENLRRRCADMSAAKCARPSAPMRAFRRLQRALWRSLGVAALPSQRGQD